MGNTSSTIEYQEAAEDDPQQRQPDITLAGRILNWKPLVPLNTGLQKTIDYFRKELQRSKHTERNTVDPHDLIPSAEPTPHLTTAMKWLGLGFLLYFSSKYWMNPLYPTYDLIRACETKQRLQNIFFAVNSI